MAILQTTTIVTSGAGPVKVPGSAETVTDSILECVSDQIQEVN